MKANVKKVVVGIFNKMTKQVEMLLLGDDHNIYKYNGEVVTANNYFIDNERIALIYRMNF